VGAYRTIKGLHESSHCPRISLALLDAHDYDEANKIHRKLSGVCEQFLHWRLESESPVVSGVEVDDVIEHAVLHRRPLRDKAQLAIPPQWQVVAAYVARVKSKMQQARAQERDMNGVAETDDGALTHETLSHDTFSQREPEVSEPMAAAKSRRMAPMAGERATTDRAAAAEVSGPIPFPGSQHSMHSSISASAQPAIP